MTGKPCTPSLFQQIMAAAAANSEAQRPAWPMNPFPRGQRDGSVTSRVLAELRRAYPASMIHGQLMHRCNARRGAVTWALAYLVARGEIEAIERPDRPGYFRYRARPPGDHHDE